jgi:DNA adenine methylase
MSRPIIKWVGGKTQLIPEILKVLPETFNDYFEPFLGGASLFFKLASTRPLIAHLSDYNHELVNLYSSIGKNHEAVISSIEGYVSKGLTLDSYLAVRNLRPEDLSDVDQAARTIYLNKAGFNGLYRLNKSGGFNVPWGKRSKVTFYDTQNLQECSKHLQAADIRQGDFEEMVLRAKKGDLVYMDPPYVPVSATSSFTGYTAGGFNLKDQNRVVNCVKTLTEEGVYVVISNADTPLVRELYADLKIHSVTARRNVNAKGDKRGPVGEVLACNF